MRTRDEVVRAVQTIARGHGVQVFERSAERLSKSGAGGMRGLSDTAIAIEVQTDKHAAYVIFEEMPRSVTTAMIATRVAEAVAKVKRP